MARGGLSYAGGVAAELIMLRAEYARLKPIERVVSHLKRTVDELARENLELRREVYRAEARKRQPSGRRRRDAGDADCVVDRTHSGSGSARGSGMEGRGP